MSGAEEIWTIVVAGGSGARFGRPKQYEQLDVARVIDRSRSVAESVSAGVVLVVPPPDAERENGVAGGTTRSASVRAGLAAVPSSASIICVHDAARPLADAEMYERVIAAVADGSDAAIPGVPVSDTIKVVENGVVVSTPARDTLIAVQTPQAFRADVLRRAHEDEVDSTDDAALVEMLNGSVVVVRGDERNRKITRPSDLEWARQQLAAEMREERS